MTFWGNSRIIVVPPNVGRTLNKLDNKDHFLVKLVPNWRNRQMFSRFTDWHRFRRKQTPVSKIMDQKPFGGKVDILSEFTVGNINP